MKCTSRVGVDGEETKSCSCCHFRFQIVGLLIESLDTAPGPSVTYVTALFCFLIVSFGKVYLPSKHGELLWTEFAFCIFLLYTPSWHRTYFCLRNSLGARKEIHIYFLFQHNPIECLLCSILVILHPDY